MHKIGAAFRQWSNRLFEQAFYNHALKYNKKGTKGVLKEILTRNYRSGSSLPSKKISVEYLESKTAECIELIKKIEAKTALATQALDVLQALTLKDLSEGEIEQLAEPAFRDLEDFRQALLEVQSVTFEELVPEEFMQIQDPVLKQKIESVAAGLKKLKALPLEEMTPEKVKKEFYEKIKNRRQK